MTGAPAGATIMYGTENGVYTLNECPKYSDVSEDAYEIYYKVMKKGYVDYEDMATVTINPKEIDLNWSETEFVYDGNAHVPQAEAEGVLENDICQIVITGEHIDAGEDYVAIASIDNSNYVINDSDRTITFCIVQAEQASPLLVPVNETISGKGDGKITGLTTEMEYRVNGRDDYIAITDSEMIFAAGTYYVRYVENNNYKASEEVEVIIGGGTMLQVNLPQSQIGYSITSSCSSLNWHDDYELEFILADGYSKTPLFDIKVNGVSVQCNENDNYLISGVEDNQTVTVEGIADITAPLGEITLGVNKWNQFLNTVTFGLFFRDTQTISITGTDFGSGIADIKYYIADSPCTEDEVKTIEEWNDYESVISLEQINKCVVYAKLTDNAGNVSYISSDGIVIENTSPVVNGIEDGKVYCESVDFTITEEYLDKVYIDGEEVTSTDGIYSIGADNGRHTIHITDKAGNETVLTITVNSDHTYEVWNTILEPGCETCGKKKSTCKYCDAENYEDISQNGHTMGAVNIENYVYVTCTEPGSYDKVVYCTVCGEELSRITQTINPEGHEYSEPEFTWSDDYSIVTGVRKCIHNPNHVDVFIQKSTSRITKPATYTEEGEIVYTMSVIVDGIQYTEKKTISIPKLDNLPTEESTTEESTTEEETTETEEPTTEESTTEEETTETEEPTTEESTTEEETTETEEPTTEESTTEEETTETEEPTTEESTTEEETTETEEPTTEESTTEEVTTEESAAASGENTTNGYIGEEKGDGNEEEFDNPITSDTRNIIMWLFTMLASGIVTFALFPKRKRW